MVTLSKHKSTFNDFNFVEVLLIPVCYSELAHFFCRTLSIKLPKKSFDVDSCLKIDHFKYSIPFHMDKKIATGFWFKIF